MSPMTARESRFRPTAMERRVRWWQAEKRRADYSPVREMPMEPADSAAVFKMLSQSCRAAAVTRFAFFYALDQWKEYSAAYISLYGIFYAKYSFFFYEIIVQLQS